LKIFVAEEQYRRLHPVPVPLISTGAINTFYFTCIPLPSFPWLSSWKSTSFQCTDLSL